MKKTHLCVIGSLLFVAVMTGLAVSTAPAQASWTPAPVTLTPEVMGVGGTPILFFVMIFAVAAVIGMHKFCAAVHRHFGIEL